MQMICNVDIMRFGTKICIYNVLSGFQFKVVKGLGLRITKGKQ